MLFFKLNKEYIKNEKSNDFTDVIMFIYDRLQSKKSTDTIGQIDEQTVALLTEMVISEEKFYSYDQEQQDAILNEMNNIIIGGIS